MSDPGDEMFDRDDYPPDFADDCNDDPDPECCDHEDRDADLTSGRAICYRCGHAWWMTGEEIDREIARIRDYEEWQRREQRPLRRLLRWFQGLKIFQRRTSASGPATDDVIPF